MELLLILTYSAICVAVFKIFRIPVNKWTLPTAALGGIFLITGILLRAAPSFDLQRTGRAAVSLLQRGVGLNRNFDYPPLHVGHDRGGREINTSILSLELFDVLLRLRIRYGTESRIKKAKDITPC